MSTTHPAPPLGTVISLDPGEQFFYGTTTTTERLVTTITLETTGDNNYPRFSFQGLAHGQLWTEDADHGLEEVNDLIRSLRLQDAVYDAADKLLNGEPTPHRTNFVDRAMEISAEARRALQQNATTNHDNGYDNVIHADFSAAASRRAAGGGRK